MAGPPPNLQAAAVLTHVGNDLQHSGIDLQALDGQFPALFPGVPGAVPAAIDAALNNMQAAMNKMQNQMNQQHAALLHRLDRIDARMANVGYDHDAVNDPIDWPPSAPGAPALPPPAARPGTWAAVQNLTAAQLQPLLLAYGLGVGDNIKASRKRLQRYLCLRLSCENPNA